MLSTLVVSTCDSMSGKQYSSIIANSRIKVMEMGNQQNLNGNHPIPFSVLALERGHSHSSSRYSQPGAVYVTKLYDPNPTSN